MPSYLNLTGQPFKFVHGHNSRVKKRKPEEKPAVKEPAMSIKERI